MKFIKPIFIIVFLVFRLGTYAQKELDVEGLKPCELFPEKKEYDIQERISRIKELYGTEVTVIELKRRSRKIKRTYKGQIIKGKEGTKELKDKVKASVILVAEPPSDGSQIIRFPLTDVNYYRIYRTDCLNN